ncbi:hypothetical protein BK126_04310 [Paenibacillus sp. FSL H7-0326]|nr:hypothetical protein BK126_04310 [Paenibacillus sp. FSL H7-0326]
MGEVSLWGFVGFMFFSTLESWALFSFIMSIFRYKSLGFIWHIVFLAFLINIQSFVLRNEFDLSFLVPLIVVIIFALFLTIRVRIPIVWATIATVMGYGFYVVLQSVVIWILFGSVANVDSQSDGYAIQTVTSILTILIGNFLYRLGKGFSFDFDRLRFKFEDATVVVVLVLFFAFTSILFFKNEIWINVLFFALIAGYLAYYALKKENGEID